MYSSVKAFCIFLLLGGFLFCFLLPAPAQQLPSDAALLYPAAEKGSVVDDYFGTKVADPYRWMENADAPQTHAWVQAENTVTSRYLAALPGRDALRTRLTRLVNYERFGLPSRYGGRLFYSHNTGLQNQSVIETQGALTAPARILLDPNILSPDGTVAIRSLGYSDDGTLLAYSLSEAGSDWETIHVRRVATGKDLPDILRWSKFSTPSWTHDDRGFFYERYPAPGGRTSLQAANYNQAVYYHVLGTPQETDRRVYARPDHKDWFLGAGVTDDGRYLIISTSQGDDPRNGVAYLDLRAGGRATSLLPILDATYSFIDNDGPVFWFQTNRSASRSKIIAVDTRRPQPRFWKELLPQTADTLQSVSTVGGRFLVTYLHDAHTVVKVFSLAGKSLAGIALPGVGTAEGFGGKRTDRDTFFLFTSYAVPTTVYHYDAVHGQVSIFRRPHVAFDPTQFETQQVFCRSKDGTRVPIFLTYKKGLMRDGQNPTLLTAYGGFDISETPYFSALNVAWMERGGVFADAVLRGGGEYGEAWHLAGTRLHKQNVFDDFLASAQFLIDEKYTSTPKLAMTGASNGGLLIGACLTQRPDLFGAAVPEVGVMDMLRFQKFTVGWGWTSDYGSSDDPEQFKALYAYSPLQNIHSGTSYPPTLILTSDHDDRVVPAHSFKFAAAMQAAQAGVAPVLIRIETRAGHGGGKPLAKVIDEQADIDAFLFHALHVP